MVGEGGGFAEVFHSTSSRAHRSTSFETPFHLILSLSKDEVEGLLRMRVVRCRTKRSEAKRSEVK
jgi:hypothetical protein